MLTLLLSTVLAAPAVDPAPEPVPDLMAYGTDAGFQRWLLVNGHTLPTGAPPAAVLRARASAYIDGYEPRWTGHRTDGAMQELAWPRTGASVNCTVAVPSDAIPPAVINATYRAAWLEASTPGVLAGPIVTAGSRVKRQKVDVIEREFFDDGKAQIGGGPAFIDPTIDGLLSAFVCDQSSGVFMWSLGN